MSDDEQIDPENENEEDADADEPQDEPIVEPAEKEIREHINVCLGPAHGYKARVHLCEGLERWALHALHDDLYWTKKALSGNTTGDDDEDAPLPPQQSINLMMVLEKTDDGAWDAKILVPDKPEEAEGDNEESGTPEQEDEEGEEPEEPEAGAAEDASPVEEVAPPQIRCDLLSLVVSQSTQCAAFFLAKQETTLDALVSFCGTTLAPDSRDFNNMFLMAVRAALEENPERSFQVAYQTFFGRPLIIRERQPDSATFYADIMKDWSAAGLAVQHICADDIQYQHDVLLFTKMLARCTPATFARLSAPPPEEDEEDKSEHRVTLPPFMAKVLTYETAEQKPYPKEIAVLCEDEAISGRYRKRGEEGGKPRYWKGDPVKGEGCYHIFYTENYGWRFRLDDQVLYVCRGVAVEDLPIRVQKWTQAHAPRKTFDIVLTPAPLVGIIPKKSRLERDATDPILTSCYAPRDTPPCSLQLRCSDIALLLLMLDYHRGTALLFDNLLQFKLNQPRALTDPVGWPHLLYMHLPLAVPEAQMKVIETAREFLRPLGLVELKPFLTDIVPKLSPDLEHYLVSHCYDIILQQSDRGGKDECVKHCVHQEKYRLEAEKALAQKDSVEALKTTAKNRLLVYDDTFLYKAVMADDVDAVVYLLDECKLPPQVRQLKYQVCIKQICRV